MLASSPACIEAGAFTCREDDDCDQASDWICVEGSCALPDDTCPQGYRYESHADPSVAGSCVSTDATSTGTEQTGSPATESGAIVVPGIPLEPGA